MTSWRVEPAWAVSCVLEDVTVLPLYITVTMTGNAGDGAEVPCINVSVDLQLTGSRGLGGGQGGELLFFPKEPYFLSHSSSNSCLMSCPTYS